MKSNFPFKADCLGLQHYLPEHYLLAGILDCAYRELYKPKIKCDAYRWFISTSKLPFTFLWIIDILKLDKERYLKTAIDIYTGKHPVKYNASKKHFGNISYYVSRKL